MERQKYNKLILETLSKLIEKYPDLRFGQILCDSKILQYLDIGKYDKLVVKDPFYEESEITWKRILLNKFAFKERYN